MKHTSYETPLTMLSSPVFCHFLPLRSTRSYKHTNKQNHSSWWW